MHSSITKAVLFSSVFLFTGCSSLESAWNSMIGDDSPKPSATAPQTQSESPKAKLPKNRQKTYRALSIFYWIRNIRHF